MKQLPDSTREGSGNSAYWFGLVHAAHLPVPGNLNEGIGRDRDRDTDTDTDNR